MIHIFYHRHTPNPAPTPGKQYIQNHYINPININNLNIINLIKFINLIRLIKLSCADSIGAEKKRRTAVGLSSWVRWR